VFARACLSSDVSTNFNNITDFYDSPVNVTTRRVEEDGGKKRDMGGDHAYFHLRSSITFIAGAGGHAV
jgi:hypothetical protein